MTAAEVIAQFNNENPNIQIDDSQKVEWHKKLESMVIENVISTHEHDLEDETNIGISVSGSTLIVKPAGTLADHIDSFDMDTELLVPAPYDDMYVFYIDQRSKYGTKDTKLYNIASTQFNNIYLAYQQYFNRNYKPKETKGMLFNHSRL